MSFWLLFKDELRGFVKSKVMLVLWIGLPLISIFFFLMQTDTEEIPLVLFVGIMVTSIASTLSGVMLATTIVNERIHHVYDLFLIRPVKRSHLLLAKLAAVYSCLILAIFLALFTGVIIDWIRIGAPSKEVFQGLWDSLALSLASMAIACSLGVFIGILVDSVMVAAILSIYLGNQFASAASLPALFFDIDPILFSLIIGITLPGIILMITLKMFEKKSL